MLAGRQPSNRGQSYAEMGRHRLEEIKRGANGPSFNI